MTENEKLLVFWLERALDIIKGEYPESQWEEYHIDEMEDAIRYVKGEK